MSSGHHPTEAGTYEPGKEVWRAQFLRALVSETEEGSILQLRRLANAHPLATHEFFTTMMTEWMLEDKVFILYACVCLVHYYLGHFASPLF
jgi:hypothetical protein